jgi:hypothetical protein
MEDSQSRHHGLPIYLRMLGVLKVLRWPKALVLLLVVAQGYLLPSPSFTWRDPF